MMDTFDSLKKSTINATLWILREINFMMIMITSQLVIVQINMTYMYGGQETSD